MMPECEKRCAGVTLCSTAEIMPPSPGLRTRSPFLAFMKRAGNCFQAVSWVGTQNMPAGMLSGKFHGSHSAFSSAGGGAACGSPASIGAAIGAGFSASARALARGAAGPPSSAAGCGGNMP